MSTTEDSTLDFDVAPSSYPILSSLWRLVFPFWILVGASVTGAELCDERSAGSRRRGLKLRAYSAGVNQPIRECGRWVL